MEWKTIAWWVAGILLAIILLALVSAAHHVLSTAS
jgi:hypothetical protein